MIENEKIKEKWYIMDCRKQFYSSRKYLHLAKNAAQLEREGHFLEACGEWNNALIYAGNKNRDWCLCRAEYCKRQAMFLADIVALKHVQRSGW